MPSSPPWIVLEPDLAFACKRCGDRMRLLAPMPLGVYVAASRAWISSHRRCLPVPAGVMAAAIAETPQGCCIACDRALPPGRDPRRRRLCGRPECKRAYNTMFQAGRRQQLREMALQPAPDAGQQEDYAIDIK